MNIPHEPVNICAQVGHVITVTLTVRCRHDESVVTRSSCWVDHGDAEPEMLHEETYSFGPFDDGAEIARVVSDISATTSFVALTYSG